MAIVKPAAVAGLFYPADPEQIRTDIGNYLAAAGTEDAILPKALILPHAGYVYSGPIAGSGYALLARLRQQIERVVILAPAHRVGFHGIGYSGASRFQTPLGEIEVDQAAMQLVHARPGLHQQDTAFANEHSIEVHLPFIQQTLDHAKIVPLLVGQSSGEQVAELLELLWGGSETLILISSDLSHYLDYDNACSVDRQTSNAIEQLKPEQIGYDQACGRTPINGLLLAARRHHLKVATLDLRNSGDTAGPKERVVGYGAYAFY